MLYSNKPPHRRVITIHRATVKGNGVAKGRQRTRSTTLSRENHTKGKGQKEAKTSHSSLVTLAPFGSIGSKAGVEGTAPSPPARLGAPCTLGPNKGYCV